MLHTPCQEMPARRAFLLGFGRWTCQKSLQVGVILLYRMAAAAGRLDQDGQCKEVAEWWKLAEVAGELKHEKDKNTENEHRKLEGHLQKVCTNFGSTKPTVKATPASFSVLCHLLQARKANLGDAGTQDMLLSIDGDSNCSVSGPSNCLDPANDCAELHVQS